MAETDKYIIGILCISIILFILIFVTRSIYNPLRIQSIEPFLIFSEEEQDQIENHTDSNTVKSSVTDEDQLFNISKNINYYEYPESFIEIDGTLDIQRLYSGYEGPLKNKKQWTKLTLAQCQDACNSMTNCIGFTRNNVNADTEATCRPRTSVSQCHTNLKGNSSQRAFASGYTSYIKDGIPSQLTVCLGMAALTLNRFISIKNEAKPFHYVAVENDAVYMKGFKTMGVDFVGSAKFMIVKGLENSNTVSFKITDAQNLDYFLYSGVDNLEIRPINVSSSTLQQRSAASFELLDGLANKHLISIRTIEMGTAEQRYWTISDASKDIPIIKIVSKTEANFKPKNSTFNIVDMITGTSIIEKITETYDNTVRNSDANRKSKFNIDMLKKMETFDGTTTPPTISTSISTSIPMPYALRQIQAGIPPDTPSVDLDSQIIKLSHNKTATDLMLQMNEVLATSQNTQNHYNDLIHIEQRKILNALDTLGKNANKIQLRDLARDFYYLESLVKKSS